MQSFVLSEEALEDLFRLQANHDPLEFVDRFYTSFALIARFPLLGMSKPHLTQARFRFYSDKPYFIIYTVHLDHVASHAILDARQDLGPLLFMRLS